MRPRGLPRRRFLAGSIAAAAIARPFGIIRAAPAFATDPFTLGVASGCPRPDGVVLWTRLAPDPLNGGGMIDAAIDVDWEIARDERFSQSMARGTATALPEFAHSVHVEASGLEPGAWYWYRFRAGNAQSPPGRTRTAFAPGTAPQALRLAFASCQQYEQGYYAAYRDMASRDLDLVIHLGDYIYENSWGSRHVRKHGVGIPTTLPEFRDRYALYKSDPDLQAAHAAFPWLVTWDDHEVADDYTSDHSPRMRNPERFLAVRAAAYQAFYEHMPLPASARPRGPDATIYGRHAFGDLLEVLVLDDRQYRSPHACLDGRRPSTLVDCPARSDAARTMLGAGQEAWLDGALAAARGRWTVIAQQTLMAELERGAGGEHRFWMDGWDGYPAARTRLLDAIATHRPSNPVVIGGDRHAFFAADLKRDFRDDRAPTIATEFVGTSITSEGPTDTSIRRALALNPHLKYARGDKRGYVTLSMSPQACEVNFETVEDEKDPLSPVRRAARFAVEDGVAGATAL